MPSGSARSLAVAAAGVGVAVLALRWWFGRDGARYMSEEQLRVCAQSSVQTSAGPVAVQRVTPQLVAAAAATLADVLSSNALVVACSSEVRGVG